MAGLKKQTDFFIAANNGSCLANKKDIMRLTGLSRAHVDKIAADLTRVGSKRTFFIPDVVEKMNRMGG